MHSTVEASVAHETTRTVVWYKTLSCAATCELEHRHCEIVRFATVSVSRVTGVESGVASGVVEGRVVEFGVVALGVVAGRVVALGVVTSCDVIVDDVYGTITGGKVVKVDDVYGTITGGKVVKGNVVTGGDVVNTKTSLTHGFVVFDTSATQTPLSFRYPGPQSHVHTAPPDQHQLFVVGATHASQPRFNAVHVADLRCPVKQLESETAHGRQLPPVDMTYPVLHTTLQSESYVLYGIKSAVHGLHTASAVALHEVDTL